MAKGINNETRSTSLKKFKADPSKNRGLCIGALTDVTVSTAEIKEDSSMETFRGLSVPRLNFVFESRKDPKGVKPSTYIHSFLAIEHTPENMTDGAWRWDQLSQTIKHFLDVYRNNKEFTEKEVKMLLVDFEEEDENGVFKEQPADVVIKAYKKFFDNVVAMFKPDGKAIYKDENGKDKIVWMKLLLDIKGRQVNNGDYGFTGFPGEGLIELYQDGVEPSLSINIAKAENIIPKAPVTAPPSGGAGVQGQGSTTVDESQIPSFMRT